MEVLVVLLLLVVVGFISSNSIMSSGRSSSNGPGSSNSSNSGFCCDISISLISRTFQVVLPFTSVLCMSLVVLLVFVLVVTAAVVK